ncbi:MAG TPA: inositol-3-phosphate synthase [bacterium]|nr:inositol-3-phosphate synthase [bacterium]
MSVIRVAIVGVGNCASALVQGIAYYRKQPQAPGLDFPVLGGYRPGDIKFVAAFDIDKRKVTKDLSQAVFAPPNCALQLVDKLPFMNVRVERGFLLDGVARHMLNYPDRQTFVVDEFLDDFCSDEERDAAHARIVATLRRTRAKVLLNYLPVGSQQATEFYAQCALDAGCALVNCMPVFIVSDPVWEKRFAARGLPCVGDDVKSQLGATVLHRTLARLFCQRGITPQHTYQLNTGGNTDFLNMLNRDRLASKRISKTEAVQAELTRRMADDDIHIGPSDWVPWQKDNKVCFLRLEGAGFAGAPIELEARLSVQDSPNSAGMVIDAIRCCQLAFDRGVAGALIAPSALCMKHPPRQLPDGEAHAIVTRLAAAPAPRRVRKGKRS